MKNLRSVGTCGLFNDAPFDGNGHRTMTHMYTLQQGEDGFYLSCYDLAAGEEVSFLGPYEDRDSIDLILDGLIGA